MNRAKVVLLLVVAALAVATSCGDRRRNVIATNLTKLSSKTFVVVPTGVDEPECYRIAMDAEMALLSSGYKVIHYDEVISEVEEKRKVSADDISSYSDASQNSGKVDGETKVKEKYKVRTKTPADYYLSVLYNKDATIRISDGYSRRVLSSVIARNDYKSIQRGVLKALESANLPANVFEYNESTFRKGIIESGKKMAVFPYYDDTIAGSYHYKVEGALVVKGINVIEGRYRNRAVEISTKTEADDKNKRSTEKNRKVKHQRTDYLDADYVVEHLCVEKRKYACTIRITRWKDKEVLGIIKTSHHLNNINTQVSAAMDIMLDGT